MSAFSHYRVDIVDPDTEETIRSTEPVNTERFVYSQADNANDNEGEPRRAFLARVYRVNDTGGLSEPLEQLIENPPPAAPSHVTLIPKAGSLIIAPSIPDESDIAGMRVWVSSEQGFDPETTDPVYEGLDLHTTVGTYEDETLYVRVALFDTFSKQGLEISDEVSVAALAPTAVDPIARQDILAREIEIEETAQALIAATLDYYEKVARRRDEIIDAREEAQSSIEVERDARISADEAEALTRAIQISALGSTVASHTSQIQTNATNHSSLVSSTDTQFATFGAGLAAAEGNITTVASDLSALTTSTNLQFSTFGTSLASVEGDITTVADDLSAFTSLTNTQLSTIGASLATVEGNITTVADDLSALTTSTNLQFSTFGTSLAAAESSITTVASDLSALTTSTTLQFSTFGTSLAAVEGDITTVADDLSAFTSSTNTQLSTLGGSLATVEGNITTVASDLSSFTSSTNSQLSTFGTSLAAVEGDITTLSSDLLAEVSNRQSAVASVAGNLATLQTSYTVTAGEVSSLSTSFTTLSATVTSQGSSLSAISSDLVTVNASLTSLEATRITSVTAGSGWAGVMMSATDTGGNPASVIRFAAQVFGFGVDYNNPFFTIDALGGEIYILSPAGHKSWQVTVDGRVRLRDPVTGVVTFDSDLGGLTEAGVPTTLIPQFGNTGSNNNVSTNGWTLVAQSSITGMLNAGVISASGYFFITTPGAVSGNSWRLRLAASGQTTVTVAEGLYQSVEVLPGDYEGLVNFSAEEDPPFGGNVTLSLEVFGPSGGSVSGKVKLIRK